MRVLAACEKSGAVRDAFRSLGHDAYSCDIEEADFPSPFHIQGDARDVLNKGWDLLIGFPPCTHLAASGAKHFAKKRKLGLQQEALDFVKLLMDAPIEKIAIENPVGVIGTLVRPPDQIIQPWEHGEPYQKSTCLWLKNLPLIYPTDIVSKGKFYISPKGRKLPEWYTKTKSQDKRSKTFLGIAQAMANQWGGVCQS